MVSNKYILSTNNYNEFYLSFLIKMIQKILVKKILIMKLSFKI